MAVAETDRRILMGNNLPEQRFRVVNLGRYEQELQLEQELDDAEIIIDYCDCQDSLAVERVEKLEIRQTKHINAITEGWQRHMKSIV